jgi:tetratricopeptide (TPR) repeat protein
MEPESPIGYRYLAQYYMMTASRGSFRENVAKLFELAQKALSLDESDSDSHALLGKAYLFMRKFDKAISEGERSIELAPNGAAQHAFLANTLYFAGRVDEAIAYYRQAIRLHPRPPYGFFTSLGRCYNMKGKYEEALEEFKKAVQLGPGDIRNLGGLAATYSLLGRDKDARIAAKNLLEMYPKFSVERFRVFVTRQYKNPADMKPIIDALRKAGIPEKAPKQPKITKTGDK